MTDTSDKAIEALAAAPWAYASADLSAMIIALQAERNQLITTADARVKAAVLAEREACAKACDKIAGNTLDFDRYIRKASGQCAAAIRSRGVTG